MNSHELSLVSHQRMQDSPLKNRRVEQLKLCVATLLFIFVTVICVTIAGKVVNEGYFDSRPNFQVIKMAVSNLSVDPSSHTVRGNWNLSLQVHNKNKRSIFFNDVTSSILYKHEILDQKRSPPFKITEKSNRFVHVPFSTINSIVDHGYVADMIDEDMAQGVHILPFDVELQGELKIRKSWMRFEVSCHNVPVLGITITDGYVNIVGNQSKHCEIYIGSRIDEL